MTKQSFDERIEAVQRRIDLMVKEGSPLWSGRVDDIHAVHGLLLAANHAIHELRVALRQATSDEPAADPAATRDMWVAWTDQDGGWIAAIGNVADRKEIEARIAAEVRRTGFNRFELRPIRITLHLNRPAERT